MIVIGEKINGAIPSVSRAIAARDGDFVRSLAKAQAEAGADFIDACASGDSSAELDSLVWLIEAIQSAVETPIAIDSPSPDILGKVLATGVLKREGLVNSVSEEGTKCEMLLPLVAGSTWEVVALTCGNDGIPSSAQARVQIAKSIIDRARRYGVRDSQLHIDPCVMALSSTPTAMLDFAECIREIKAYAPEAKVTGAISNISFDMPSRKTVNAAAIAMAVAAGLDSAIMDPTDREMLGALYAAEALSMSDKGGRKYNRAYRAGKFGNKPAIQKARRASD